MKDKYDIVVIGSGIGGLVSAALLSNAGKKVLIIEKEPKPGGYLTEFKDEGFLFDVSLHLLNGCSEGQYSNDVFSRCGIIDDINFVKPKYLYRSVFPDLDVSIPQSDFDAYKKLLIEHFPKSENGIDSLFKKAREVFRGVATEGSSAPIIPELSAYLKTSASAVMNHQIKDKRLKALLCQIWMYFGLPPSMMRAVDFWYPWFDYAHNGGYYLEKGSAAIVKALVNRIKNNGGDFLFNKSVGRIVVENDICKKVSFGKNEIFSDVIISDIDLDKTVYELIGIDKFRPSSVKKLKTIKPSISAFDIFMGLDIDLKKIYTDDYEIFVNTDYDIDRQYRSSLQNRARTAPFAIAIYSNVNKFAAPEGKSVVTITMLSGYNYWVSRSEGEYQNKKHKVADILVKRAANIIPEIKSHMQRMIVSSPVTFERYTNNSKGAIYGYVQTAGSGLEVRPNELMKIKNLYFASAWARQGSGIMKVLRSADEVTRKILRSAPIGV